MLVCLRFANKQVLVTNSRLFLQHFVEIHQNPDKYVAVLTQFAKVRADGAERLYRCPVEYTYNKGCTPQTALSGS